MLWITRKCTQTPASSRADGHTLSMEATIFFWQKIPRPPFWTCVWHSLLDKFHAPSLFENPGSAHVFSGGTTRLAKHRDSAALESGFGNAKQSWRQIEFVDIIIVTLRRKRLWLTKGRISFSQIFVLYLSENFYLSKRLNSLLASESSQFRIALHNWDWSIFFRP